ncbi:MAG: S8 family serine peptidase [Bacteroidales bacterium]
MKKIISALFLVVLSLSVSMAGDVMSPYTKDILKQRYEHVRMKSLAGYPTEKELISCYVTVDSDDVIERLIDYGVGVNSVIGNIITAMIPLDVIDNIAIMSGVIRIEAGDVVSLTLDKGRDDTGVNKMLDGIEITSGYNGTGVVVGIIDEGLQFDHINFYDTSSNLRIKRVWLQDNEVGTPPAGFTYGSEYKTQTEIESVKYDTPGGTHATHVTGIAAGGYMKSGFYGVATGADIVFVSYSNRSTSVSDALSYIYNYAREVDKPVVVNMSLGNFIGPRDGNSTFDKIADKLQGSGRLLVGAAGNEGDSYKHISKTFTTQPDTLQSFVTGDYKLADTDYIEIYGEVNSPVSVKVALYDIVNNRILIESPLLSTRSYMSYTLPLTFGINGSVNMYAEVEPSSNRPHVLLVKNITKITSGYAIAVKITSLAGKTINAWDYKENFTDCGLSGWTYGDNNSTMLEIGGTGKRIITVGSYVTKLFNPVTLNDISPMSSRGPTLDGRRKPDVTAPGDVLVSSYSDSPNIINSNYYKPLIIMSMVLCQEHLWQHLW